MQNLYSQKEEAAMKYSAFIMGALLGAGAALLLAPHAGAELRGMLSDHAGRAKDDLLEKAEEVFDKGDEIFREAGQSAKEFAQQGKEAVKDAGRMAQASGKHAQDFVREPGRSAL